MCLFQKHVGTVSYSLLLWWDRNIFAFSFNAYSRGEKRELHFLAFWRTWGKDGKNPCGRKLRGWDRREVGLETEDLSLCFDWIRWGEQGQTEGWFWEDRAPAYGLCGNSLPCFALFSFGLIQSGDKSQWNWVCVRASVHVCLGGWVNGWEGGHKKLSLWQGPGLIQRPPVTLLTLGPPSTAVCSSVCLSVGHSLSGRGAAPQHHLPASQPPHVKASGLHAAVSLLALCHYVAPTHWASLLQVKTGSNWHMNPKKVSTAITGQTKPAYRTKDFHSETVPDGEA